MQVSTDGGEMENRMRTGLPDTVILVHGLWMTGVELSLLGRRLKRCGFEVRYFRYRSWRGTLDEAALRLGKLAGKTAGERVHFVGHSLGGIVIARMLELYPSAGAGNVAFLASPMGGSALVTSLSRCRIGRFILGRVIDEALTENRPVWPQGRDLLVVAGTFPLGFGVFFGVPSPHDGTIAEVETRVDGAKSIQVRTSHMGMVISPEIAEILCNFFRGDG